MARPISIPSVGEMTRKQWKALIIGQSLAVARQRYRWEGGAIPVVVPVQGGYRIIEVMDHVPANMHMNRELKAILLA